MSASTCVSSSGSNTTTQEKVPSIPNERMQHNSQLTVADVGVETRKKRGKKITTLYMEVHRHWQASLCELRSFHLCLWMSFFFSLMRSATWHWARLHSVLGVQHPKSSWILQRMLFVSPKLIHCQSNLPQPSPPSLLSPPTTIHFAPTPHKPKKKDFLFGIQNRSGVGLSFWRCSNPSHQNSISVTPVA